MMKRFQKLVTAAATAILACTVTGTPVLAASSATKAYIASNNFAIIDAFTDPTNYAEIITKTYDKHLYTSATYSGRYYGDPEHTIDFGGLLTTTYNYAYNDEGKVTQGINAREDFNEQFSVTYDDHGYPVQSSGTSWNFDTDSSEPYQLDISYVYNEAGQPTNITYSDSSWAYAVAYDKYGRISDINCVSTDGQVDNYHYSYKSNRLVKMVYTTDGQVQKVLVYQYDNAKRLTTVNSSNGEAWVFAYNADGSLASYHDYSAETQYNDDGSETGEVLYLDAYGTYQY